MNSGSTFKSDLFSININWTINEHNENDSIGDLVFWKQYLGFYKNNV
jgi:hypothetical protein